MKSFLAVLGIALAIHLALAAAALGEGFLFHWLFPALDVGMGVLAAAVLIAASGVLFFKVIGFLMSVEIEAEDEEAEDDDEDDPPPPRPSGHRFRPPPDRPRDRRRRRR
jgi:hypothetical protein